VNTRTPAADVSLARALDRFRFVPADVASYDTDAVAAARALRVGRDQVAELAVAGLPHMDDPERGPLFDFDDVMNVGKFSGTGVTGPELALRFLMRFSALPPETWYSPRQWVVTVAAAGPDGSDGPTQPPGEVSLRGPDLTAPGIRHLGAHRPGAGLTEPSGAEFQTRPYQVAVRITGAMHVIADPRARAVFDEVVQPLVDRAVVFQSVAETLRADHERAWRLGIADCMVASKVLADRLRGLGLSARVRRGYQLGLYGSDHAWCELEEDGEYKSLDPLYSYLGRVGAPDLGLTPSPTFAAAAFGGRFNRLLPFIGDNGDPLVYLDGRPAPYWALAGVSARPYR
jgi:hypothetical protein